MKQTKRIAALLCAVLLTFAACGKSAPQSETTAGTDAAQTTRGTDAASPSGTGAGSDASAPQQAASETTTEAAQDAGLNSTDTAEVLAFYREAAAKNDARQYTKTLTLISLDGGEGKVGSYVHVFEPIAKKAVANNTVTDDPLPGKYARIRPEDWKSASAVSDGKYTTIRVQVAEQTDDANGKAFEGSVGRSMTVLDGVSQAVDEMPGVSADFANGKVRIEYRNPTITVKVDNRTGKFVPGSCKWSYRVHVVLESLDAKVLLFNVHLQNAAGVIDYAITY